MTHTKLVFEGIEEINYDEDGEWMSVDCCDGWRLSCHLLWKDSVLRDAHEVVPIQAQFQGLINVVLHRIHCSALYERNAWKCAPFCSRYNEYEAAIIVPIQGLINVVLHSTHCNILYHCNT